MVAMNEVLRDLEEGKLASFTPKQAIIAVTGSDAQSFLSRLSTNDLREIFERGFLQTSFTNNKGRMIDHCLLFSMRSDEIIVVSSHEDSQILHDWLNQFHFIEDVTINVLKNTYALTYLVTSISIAHENAFLVWHAQLNHGKTLNIYATLSPQLTAMSLTDEVFEVLRIMCMMPRSPREIHGGVMPQNINLEEFISEQKGCYIGQEVIAKARTYQKQVKSLCGIKVLEERFHELVTGLHIINDQGQIGEITSVAPIYVAGETNALVISDLLPKASPRGDALALETAFIEKNSHKS